MTTLTPERAHIESLKRSILRTENAHAGTLVECSYLKAELEAADAALQREHARAAALEARARSAEQGPDSPALLEFKRERDEARAALDLALEDEKVLSSALTAILTELDRVIAGGLVLKTPSEALDFAKRVRALAAPPDEPTS